MMAWYNPADWGIDDWFDNLVNSTFSSFKTSMSEVANSAALNEVLYGIGEFGNDIKPIFPR